MLTVLEENISSKQREENKAVEIFSTSMPIRCS